MTTVEQSKLLTPGDLSAAQQKAVDALYEGNRLAIAGKGFGKAAVGQTAVEELLFDEHVQRVLILAPLKVCQLTWAKEWAKWSHLSAPAMATGDVDTRKSAIDGKNPIVVMNFENVKWLFATYGKDHGFDGLLVDEMSKLKSAGAATVKALRPRLKDFKWRSGMSASPVAEAGIDIYAQALIIDKGKALGRDQDTFRRKYFYPTDFEQRKWAPMPGMDNVLADDLKGLIYMADDEEYLKGLPGLRDKIAYVDMGEAAQEAYDKMCTEMYIDFTERDVEAVNQAVVTGKLTQITAGAIYTKNKRGEQETQWLHWAKFEALDQLVKRTRGPVAVAYQYQFELAELRIRYPNIAVLGDDPEGVEAEWSSGQLMLMALHPKSASHGLNLQYGGHELIVLTPPWGADPWEQLIGRFRRRGQQSDYVTRTTIVVPDTIDEIILDRLLGKAQDEDSLMGHMRQVAQT